MNNPHSIDSKWHKQAIALAGLSQAVNLVDRVAKTGYLDNKQFETCIKSLFITSPSSTIEVYENLSDIRSGLEILVNFLKKGQSQGKAHLVTYGLGILHLQKKLSQNTTMLSEISKSLDTAKNQSLHFGPTHENVVANLADIYSRTLSTFTFRIQVAGDQQYLQQPRIANQVRVLLLAAIRASILWRQSGGNRWVLVFKRSALLLAAEHLLKQAQEHPL